ncbi:RHS repeat-associated core domain-containing protein [Cytophagaceae bacterium ABcell3]|nr:RHS repeat-associated core domain-containing protein [Cytophagaceae bacterium ABcell3]
MQKQDGSYKSTTYIDGIFEHTRESISAAAYAIPNLEVGQWTIGVYDQGTAIPDLEIGQWIIGQYGGSTTEQNTLHIMDDQSRIATIRLGDAMGDITPAIKYNLEDHLGSSSIQLDTNGTLVNSEEYYPFGETSFGSYGKKRYRFCGKEKDEESGLYYYGMRYYNAWTCRFVSVDPLAGKFPHLSPYNYAGNKPITHKDLYGLQGTGDEPVDSGNDNMQIDPGDENFGKHKEGDLVPEKEWTDKDVGKRIKVNGTEYEITGLRKENYKYYKDSDGNKRYTNRRAERVPMSEMGKIPGVDKNHPDLVPIGGRAKELDFKPESASRNVPILKEYIPPPPPPVKDPDPIVGPDPIVDPLDPVEEPVDPGPTTSNLNLDVPFKGNRVSIRDPKAAEQVLTPILESLLADPRNNVTLRPNTNWSQGQDIPDLWGLIGDADTSDELVQGRGHTITKWFTDRGVDPSQINIVIDKDNFNTTINVTGVLQMFK